MNGMEAGQGQDDSDTGEQKGDSKFFSPPWAPCIYESIQLPTHALCKQGNPRASLAFKVLLIQHEKAIFL